jgi:hypothetical protein
MPLQRLSDVKGRDGRVSIGSMSHQARLVELEQPIWARVSMCGERAEFTTNHFPGVKANMSVAYENHRFRVERVIPIASRDEQMTLECVKVGSIG